MALLRTLCWALIFILRLRLKHISGQLYIRTTTDISSSLSMISKNDSQSNEEDDEDIIKSTMFKGGLTTKFL